MATNSYIQRNANIGVGAGKRLMINVIGVSRGKGVRVTDIPVPSAKTTSRALFPLSGEINDFNLLISIETESSNVGYSVSTSNVLTSDSITTIQQQYNFIYDEILGNAINSNYTLYLDWLGKSYFGSLFVDSNIDPTDFSGQIEVTLEFKEGKNWFGTPSNV